MKKIALACIAASLSLNAFADGVMFNTPECWNNPHGEIGGCIQNKTSMSIHDISYKEVNNYNNGSHDWSVSYTALTQEYFISAFYSADILKKLNIRKKEISLWLNGKAIPGCKMDITPYGGNMPTLTLREVQFSFYCS